MEIALITISAVLGVIVYCVGFAVTVLVAASNGARTEAPVLGLFWPIAAPIALLIWLGKTIAERYRY